MEPREIVAYVLIVLLTVGLATLYLSARARRHRLRYRRWPKH
jgi:hypothetical protein